MFKLVHITLYVIAIEMFLVLPVTTLLAFSGVIEQSTLSELVELMLNNIEVTALCMVLSLVAVALTYRD